jgi:hypothetical protein
MNNLPLEWALIGWTENIRRAIANANGRLLGQERNPAEVVDEVMAEMTASKE